MSLGEQLKKWREEKGMTIEEVAAQLNIALSSLREMEQSDEISPDVVLKIVKIFDREPSKSTDKYYQKREPEVELVGSRLRRLREERGLSLNELSRQSGVSAAHLSEIERSLSTPSLKTLEKLAQVINVPTGQLFPTNEEETLGQKVRRLRETMGLTQKDLGDMVGITDSMITQIENDRTQPSIKVLNSLGKSMGVNTSYFLMGSMDEDWYWDYHNNTTLKEALKRYEIRQVVDLIAAWTEPELLNLVGIIERLNTYRSPLDAQYREIKTFLERSTNEERQVILDLIELIKKPEIKDAVIKEIEEGK
ncbi:MAG TPA: helix-turn-helix domain-containing protein [Syntrophomonas sp.]|nr:helix-turn-helix domain-containing protein [Syntrophomonas sp.]